ncbi:MULTISPECIES: VIT family protein [unclassified Kitasatospora]|uniref:VIT1/CCC1 transporter family protein n=1 Tax=unclassified Kitasatospora TaxID=2633591 RepID=UPI00342C2A9F
MAGQAGKQDEPHGRALGRRLNWLRAGVLGANDGVVSTAGLVIGVAGATTSHIALLTAGLAGLLAGSMSMAVGEYVSVSSQRDSERAALLVEQGELAEAPEAELDELTGLYEAKGLPPALARDVAEQLTERDPLAAHADAELKLDPDALTSAWQAAGASFVSFTAGSLLPLLVILLLPVSSRVPVTAAAVLAALWATGAVSARLGGAPPGRAILRNVLGGGLAMAVTYGVGVALGVTGV